MSEEREKQVADSGSGGKEEVPDPELDNLLNGMVVMCVVYMPQNMN